MTPRSKISKRLIDRLQPKDREYTIWDSDLATFGVRVRKSGVMSYVVMYRAGKGRGAPLRKATIAAVGKITPEEARTKAQCIIGAVAGGGDPAADARAIKTAVTLGELAEDFLTQHVALKRKESTARDYGSMIDRHIRPELGHKRAIEVSRADVARLHLAMKETPYRANRMLAVLGSLYTFGQRRGLIPDEVNPSRKIEKYREHKRERYLSMVELDRLGAAIASAEADGVISKYAATAIRLLLFTGARLGEILNLKWEHVDFERALLHLPDSKTGRKTIVLNNAAMAILEHASRQEGNPYVIVGQKPEAPITHMKKPWKILVKRAGLEKARLHDLRHTFASYGAGAGLGLPIIGKLLGHSQPQTTARYAHLDADPMRLASEKISCLISSAMDGNYSQHSTRNSSPKDQASEISGSGFPFQENR